MLYSSLYSLIYRSLRSSSTAGDTHRARVCSVRVSPHAYHTLTSFKSFKTEIEIEQGPPPLVRECLLQDTWNGIICVCTQLCCVHDLRCALFCVPPFRTDCLPQEFEFFLFGRAMETFGHLFCVHWDRGCYPGPQGGIVQALTASQTHCFLEPKTSMLPKTSSLGGRPQIRMLSYIVRVCHCTRVQRRSDVFRGFSWLAKKFWP